VSGSDDPYVTRWIEASQVSRAADYGLMAQLIAEAIAE
jgi:hypothetical protein